MDYETSANIRDFLPTLLAGVFSKNALFSDNDAVPSNETETEEK
jgi:CRISPR-associated protein Csh1